MQVGHELVETSSAPLEDARPLDRWETECSPTMQVGLQLDESF